MKKILVCLLCVFIFPMVTHAVNYDIENYYILANVRENGDMDVSELIVMDGTFNGYEVGLEYNTGDIYSASSLENVYIGGLQGNIKNIDFSTMDLDFENFIKVDYANSGDILKYTENIGYYKNTYRMYYKTNNTKTLFLFKYTLKDVAILHVDAVEIYWNFFSQEFRDDIKDLNIRIVLPKSVSLDEIHWWFHGNLAGYSSINEGNDKQVIDAHLDYLKAYNPVDFRVLFPKTLVNEGLISKKDNSSVLDKIIAEEDEIVRQDLEYLKQAKFAYYSTVVGCILFYIFLIGAFIYTYYKFDKERVAKFQNKYNREFIEDYNVEVIDYLMHKRITENAMSASIMNMIYKKNIEFEKIDDDKKNYKFILKNQDNLNDTEIMLVNFLFSKVGSNGEFTTTELKRYASGTKTCETFMSTFTAWKNKVEQDGRKQEFFEQARGKGNVCVITFIFAFVVFMWGFLNNVETPFMYLIVPALIIFYIYLLSCHRKTEKGIEHYAMWTGFKNFLKDFGNFSIKELPEVVLWERYLVYATIFGLADTVEKTMNVKIKELVATPGYEYLNDVYIFHHIHVADVVSSSIASAYRGAQSTISSNIANSSGGSFGGHGGGFSSGGGFGGGGRSGGGF